MKPRPLPVRLAGAASRAALFSATLLSWATLGCATLDEAGGGNDNLPIAGAGPFREIETAELGSGRAAPYALRDDDDFPRDAAVIDADGDTATFETWAFVARTIFDEDVDPDVNAPPNEIARHVAADGRTFERTFDVIVVPDLMWEMDTVAQPAVVRHGSEVLLYYAAGGGIGHARSTDGVRFEKTGEPVLAPTGGWEQMTPPKSPAVVVMPDDTLRMYYEVPLPTGSAIGLATSPDGRTWSRVGTAPTLSPRDGEIDAGGAGAPFVLLANSSEGRSIERLYYTATDADARTSIALVARYAFEGPWDHARAAVFGATGSLQPTEANVLPYDGFAYLFVTMKAGTTNALDYPAVAVGVAPADAQLPPRSE